MKQKYMSNLSLGFLIECCLLQASGICFTRLRVFNFNSKIGIAKFIHLGGGYNQKDPTVFKVSQSKLDISQNTTKGVLFRSAGGRIPEGGSVLPPVTLPPPPPPLCVENQEKTKPTRIQNSFVFNSRNNQASVQEISELPE